MMDLKETGSESMEWIQTGANSNRRGASGGFLCTVNVPLSSIKVTEFFDQLRNF
jgi:hypothetical protein